MIDKSESASPTEDTILTPDTSHTLLHRYFRHDVIVPLMTSRLVSSGNGGGGVNN